MNFLNKIIFIFILLFGVISCDKINIIKSSKSNTQDSQENISELKKEIDNLKNIINNSSINHANVDGFPDFSSMVSDLSLGVVSIEAKTRKNVRKDIYDQFQDDDFYQFFQDLIPNENIITQVEYGSGFIISKDGYIITNAHVIENMNDISITLNDKRKFKAKLIGLDKKTDIALLKINADNLSVVKIGSIDKTRVGQWVLAIGAPFGFDNSVTAGIISAMKRNIDSSYGQYIQTDVAINPGSSGSPLFNLSGEVIGVNSSIFSSTGSYNGISFAVPIDIAMNVVNQLKTTGKVNRGEIGVTVQSLNYELSKSFGLNAVKGALIVEVLSGGYNNEKIKEGDIILGVKNQDQIFNVDNPSDLPYLIGFSPIGSEVTLKVWRDKKELEIPVKISKPVNKSNLTKKYTFNNIDFVGELEKTTFKIPELDLVLAKIPDSLAKAYNIRGGSIILVAGKKANNLNLNRGDIIISIDGKVANSEDVFKNILKLNNIYIPVLLMRNGQKYFIPLEINK